MLAAHALLTRSSHIHEICAVRIGNLGLGGVNAARRLGVWMGARRFAISTTMNGTVARDDTQAQPGLEQSGGYIAPSLLIDGYHPRGAT